MDLDKSYNKNPSKKHHTRHNGTSNLVRIKTYPIELIFDFIRDNPMDSTLGKNFDKKKPGGYYVDLEGNQCKLRRARVFFEIGTDCVECQAKAKLFALETWPDGSVHFELYALDKSGEEVLMTIDHIVAKYNGGLDKIENYAPLCKVCNELKGWS